MSDLRSANPALYDTIAQAYNQKLDRDLLRAEDQQRSFPPPMQFESQVYNPHDQTYKPLDYYNQKAEQYEDYLNNYARDFADYLQKNNMAPKPKTKAPPKKATPKKKQGSGGKVEKKKKPIKPTESKSKSQKTGKGQGKSGKSKNLKKATYYY